VGPTGSHAFDPSDGLVPASHLAGIAAGVDDEVVTAGPWVSVALQPNDEADAKAATATRRRDLLSTPGCSM
jgi:hypothetical protein